MKTSTLQLRLVVLLVALAQGLVLGQESEILVGQDSAGAIKIDIEFPLPLALPPSVYPGFPGYATGALGLHSTLFDDPTNDLFLLSTGADFRLVLLAQDPGMEIWTGTGYLSVGDSFYVGPPAFDTHPIWNLTNGTPGMVYSLMLKLHDLNGVYPDSDPFELSFTPQLPIVAIQIAPLDATHVQLTWPTNAAGWILESAASLPTASWIAVTNAPDTSGTNYTLNLSSEQAQQFFRLHMP